MSSPRTTQMRPYALPGQPYGPFWLESEGNPAGGSSGLPGAGERELKQLTWCNPTTREDGLNGQVIRGVWYPASMIREVDGTLYGEPFAPEHRLPSIFREGV